MISCYNARSNDPYKDSQHPTCTPLETVPEDRIKACGNRASASDQVFMGVDDDASEEREAARKAAHSSE